MILLLCYLFLLLIFDELILECFIFNGVDMYVVYFLIKKFILFYVIENCLIEVFDVVLRIKYNVNKFESNGEVFIFFCLLLGIKINKFLLKCYI